MPRPLNSARLLRVVPRHDRGLRCVAEFSHPDKGSQKKKFVGFDAEDEKTRREVGRYTVEKDRPEGPKQAFRFS